MNKDLILLIQLSDLDTQLSEMEMENYKSTGVEIGFKMHGREKEIAKLRDDIRKKIEPSVLADYDKILKRYKFRAVAQASDDVCYGCFTRLPTEFISIENKNEKIIHCPNCRRILYWIE